MAKDLSVKAIVTRRLKANQARAGAARATLVRSLAKMSADQLRHVPTSVWMRLGSQGLIEVIRQSTVLARLDLAPQTTLVPTQEEPPENTWTARISERIDHWRSVEPLWWVVAASAARGALVASLLVLVAPAAQTAAQNMGWLSKSVWCQRLDRWANTCHYKIESDRMTMERAAQLLHLPSPTLFRAHNLTPDEGVLPRGFIISVPARDLSDYFQW